jgi:hypothetical protein
MDEVNIQIEELVLEHLAAGSDPRGNDAWLPSADRLGRPVTAEIRRAVSAAINSGSTLEA